MNEPAAHVSALRLNARSLGHLSGDEANAVDSHVESCERCRQRAAGLEADADRFRREVFPRTLPRLEERTARRGGWRWLWAPAFALAALPIALLVVRPRAPAPDLETKGGPVVQLFARRGVQVFAVEPDGTLRPGDQLRFAVDPGDLDHVLIVSRDGAGSFSVYYPFGGLESGAVTPEARSELPGSVVLDGTLGQEHLWAVFSSRPLLSRAVVEALSAHAYVAGAGRIVEFEFRKAAP